LGGGGRESPVKHGTRGASRGGASTGGKGRTGGEGSSGGGSTRAGEGIGEEGPGRGSLTGALCTRFTLVQNQISKPPLYPIHTKGLK